MPIDRSAIPLGSTTTVCNVAWENAIVGRLNNISINAADVTVFNKLILGMVPNYANVVSVQVQPGYCRDSTNTQDLTTNSTVGVSLLDFGLNGVLQSTNLSGVVSVNPTINFTAAVSGILTFASAHNLTTGQAIIVNSTGTLPGGLALSTPYYVRVQTATTVTLFTSKANAISNTSPVTISSTGSGTHFMDGTKIVGTGTSFSSFVVGDTITPSGCTSRRIASIDGELITTTEAISGETVFEVNFRRGGLAANTWWYLYVISNGATTGFAFSTRNSQTQTLVDLPGGYSYYRQLPFAVKVDGNKQLLPYYIATGWPFRPEIRYIGDFSRYGFQSTTHNLLSGLTTSWQTFNTSNLVPPIADVALLNVAAQYAGGSYGNAGFRPTGDASANGISIGGAATATGQLTIKTDMQQRIDAKVTYSSTAWYVDVIGYIITGV